MLALEVELLTGRYVATAYEDRNAAEWPPHPARLFSALVATHFETGEGDAAERASLAWLERQPPPEIAASAAVHRDVVTVFVPVNDATVVGSFDDQEAALAAAEEEVAAARAAGDAKRLKKAEAQREKAATSRRDAFARATAPLDEKKASPAIVAHGASIQPERRKRQPRTFPSVRPDEPRVTFAWPDATPPDDLRAALDRLAARVVRLGHSSSLVSIRVTADEAHPTWRPDPEGTETLRWVGAGQLERLDDEHARSRGTEPRVLPATFPRYSAAAQVARERETASAFGDEWIVFRRVDGPTLPMRRAVDVARAMRNCVMRGHGPDAPEILTGHRDGGSPSERAHLAVVPLPHVGFHGDGGLRGVALVLPRDASLAERRLVFRALGAALDPDHRLALKLGSAGVLDLELVEDVDLSRALTAVRPETWCRPAARWATATPVALDRNPGDLHARDPEKAAAAFAEAEASIAAACEHIGLPRPRVTVLPAAPLQGAEKARVFPPYPGVEGRAQRVLVHAALAFDQRVRGPVLVGAGRYYGLGLFRPLDGGGEA